MSLLLSWRRFGFFDREQVMDVEKPGEPFLGLEKMEAVGTAGGGGIVIIGEREGGVTLLQRSMAISYWKAHAARLRHIAFARPSGVLFTVGEDVEGGISELKAWHLHKTDKGVPFCSRVSRVQLPGGRQSAVSAVAVEEGGAWLAVGFEDSSVLLFRGDLARDKGSAAKPSLLRDGLSAASDGAVHGLAFRQLPNGRMVVLCVTSHAVLGYVVREKETERTLRLDAKGAEPNCWALAGPALQHQLIVARRDMVFFYNPGSVGQGEEAPGKCFGFDGDKVLVRAAGPYLAVVTRDVSALTQAKGEPMHTLTLYDIPEQYIAFSGPMPEVMELFYEWGCLWVLCRSGKLFRLAEKELGAKLGLLFRKNLFDLATALASRSGQDRESLAAIFKKHGDYLYAKGDYDNAVREYVQTLGALEPSYVIRKFLDAQRIAQLTKYLEAVHRAGLGSSEHTTILLNCYTKLGDASKIAAFLKASASDMPFDLDVAIKVLSGGNYVKEALQLAREHRRHDLVLHILLEKQRDAKTALSELGALSAAEACPLVRKWGKALVTAEPAPTEALLKDLCRQGADPKLFLNVFLDHPELLQDFLERMGELSLGTGEDGEERSGEEVGNTLLELYLRTWATQGKTKAAEDKVLAFLKDPASKYQDEQALVLCQMSDFSAGQLFLYEKLRLYSQILAAHMKRRDFASVIATCKRFGEAGEREMWIEALWFLAKSEDAEAVDWVRECLEQLEKMELLPPLMVLEILSHSQSVTLGVVREYLLGWLEGENRRIAEDQAASEAAQERIDELDALVFDLQNKPQTFQVSKCSACGSGLEVPAVHFFCKHSYHLSCFEGYAESESECPMCGPANAELRASLSAQGGGGREAYAALRADLATSKDSIRTVAEHFSRGVFGKGDRASPAAAPPPKEPPRKQSLNPFGDDDDE